MNEECKREGALAYFANIINIPELTTAGSDVDNIA